MGLLTGAISFIRYKVDGELPVNFWDFAGERISQHLFRDIDENYEERSVGWVAIDNMFDTSFEYSSYAAGDYLVLTLRVDERKVSPKVLNKFCLKEEERVRKERQLPKLNRNQRVEIRENMRLKLVKKAVPSPATYDLCWNLAQSTLFFFATGEKAQVELEELFKDTFDLALVRQIPYSTAENLLDSANMGALASLTPDVFC